MKKKQSLVLSESSIQKVQNNDKLFANALEKSKLDLIKIIRAVPGYAKLITDKMRENDVFVATITKEARAGIDNGQLEKMLKKDSKLWNGMIRNAKGKKEIVEQANWQKVDLSSEMLSNLTQISLHASVAELSEKILEINKKLDELLICQHSNNIAKITAGIATYYQAYQSKDIGIRNHQLANAAQTLNEGRAVLMHHLENILRKDLRDPKFTDRLWNLISIDKRAVDLTNDILHDYSLIKEDIQYINLSTAYLTRIHTLWGQYDSAVEAKKQYMSFCNFLLEGMKAKEIYFPYEMDHHFSLEKINDHFKTAQRVASNAFDIDRELAIEIKYEELKDEKMQEMLQEHPRG